MHSPAAALLVAHWGASKAPVLRMMGRAQVWVEATGADVPQDCRAECRAECRVEWAFREATLEDSPELEAAL